MPRFPAYRSPYDDTPLIDGDSAFRGFASRIQPTALAPGILARSENLRLEQALAQPRKGAKALCSELVLRYTSLTLDFALDPDIPGVSITYDPATLTATARLAAPLPVHPDRHRIAIEPGSAVPSASDSSPLQLGILPAPFDGTFDLLSIAPDRLSFTFAPYDERGDIPALYDGPFTVNHGPILYSIESDSVRGALVATDRKNREMVVMALIDRVVIYRPGLPVATISYPAETVLGDTQEVSLVQFIDKVYIFRGDSTSALQPFSPSALSFVWDMDFTHPFAHVPQGPHPSGEPTLVRQPPAEWGVVFNRQLILPFGRDQLIASDFGDPDTYDKQFAQLRIMPGGNDWLVAAHPYQQARVLVFYRKSVHLVTFMTGDLYVDTVYELTRELGCAARTTIKTCGAQILWLADTGVHALNIGAELNLTAAAAPLSEPVQDIIDRIHWPRAHRATAAYHGNRYYLALPLDGSTRNNAILIYNFLNAAWETLDTYPGDFDILDFAILDHDGQHRLHAVTTYGYVYLLDEHADGLDDQSIDPDSARTQVRARLLTRAITHGTIEPKRFTHLQLETDMEAGETITVANITRNPDHRRELLTLTATKSTDHTRRIHLRARGVAAQIDIMAITGRPQIKGLLLEASSANNQDTPRA